MDQVTFVSVLLVLMMLLLPLFSKMLKRYPKQLKTGKVMVLSTYLCVNLYLTIFSREPRMEYLVNWIPFWSYSETVQGNSALGIQMILNVFLYVPLGYLLSYTFSRIKARHIVIIGCLMSILTEVTQYVFRLGLSEIDDVLHNTLGTVMGVFCYKGTQKILDSNR